MDEINWKMFIVPFIILFLFVGGIIGVVNWQRASQAPKVSISVNLPEGETETSSKDLTVNGKVEKGDKVFVNDQEAKVASDGSYSKTITLSEGKNKVAVKDVRGGKEVETVQRTVKLASATPTLTAPTPQAGGPSAGGQPAATPTQPSNLSTSGPEEIVIPVVGFAGLIVAVGYYIKTKKKLKLSFKK